MAAVASPSDAGDATADQKANSDAIKAYLAAAAITCWILFSFVKVLVFYSIQIYETDRDHCESSLPFLYINNQHVWLHFSRDFLGFKGIPGIPKRRDFFKPCLVLIR